LYFKGGVYAILLHEPPPTISYAKYLATQFDYNAGWTSILFTLLSIIAIAAHVIAALHKALETGDR
jgi:hypothetical protein